MLMNFFNCRKTKKSTIINNDNNSIITVKGENTYNVDYTNIQAININGKNNQIILDYNEAPALCKEFPSGLKIYINGNNNKIKINFPVKFSNTRIKMLKNENTFELKPQIFSVSGANFNILDGAIIKIGRNCQLDNGDLILVASTLKNSKIIFGDEVYCARGLLIRNNDGHTLIDATTQKALNPPKDVIIGNHVWIASKCTILKGTEIPDNTMVAACSLVNKKFTEENTILAGSPAKIIRKNVSWDTKSYCEYIDEIILI